MAKGTDAALTYNSVERHIKMFEQLRDEWTTILTENSYRSTEAAQHILSINAKLELLQMFRDPERE